MGVPTRGATEIVPFNQQWPHSAPRRLHRQAHTVNTATHHDELVMSIDRLVDVPSDHVVRLFSSAAKQVTVTAWCRERRRREITIGAISLSRLTNARFKPYLQLQAKHTASLFA